MKIRRSLLRAVCAAAALLLCLSVIPSLAKEADERTTVDIVFDFLTTDLELNAAAACGVLANIEKESAFRYDVYGDGGTSYGICQWHDYTDSNGSVVGRFTDLRNFCEENDLDWQSVEGQLEYLKHELTAISWYRTTLEYLRGVPNTDLGAYDAADYWCQHFEIPADKERNGALRGTIAREKYWLLYGDGSFTDDGSAEIWRVVTNGVVCRAAPSSRSIVTDTLTAGTELRVTEIRQNKDETWIKVPFGWCLIDGFEYVSGRLFSVKYQTNCSVPVADDAASFGSEVILASGEGLAKFGFVFAGWDVGGQVYQPGEAISPGGNVTAVAVWERDASVALLRGDANADGKVNARDVTLIMKKMIGGDVWLSGICSDVNGDAKLNAKDVTALMKFIVGEAIFEPEISAEEEAAWEAAQREVQGDAEADPSDGSDAQAGIADPEADDAPAPGDA